MAWGDSGGYPPPLHHYINNYYNDMNINTMYKLYTITTLIAIILTITYRMGVGEGEQRTINKVNDVLEAQAKLPHLGGTWDVMNKAINH